VIEFMLPSSGRGVWRLRFSPDGRYLAVWDSSGILSLHDTSTGRARISVRVGANRSLGFWGGSDGRTLFAYSYHDGLIPFDPDGEEIRPALDGSTELVEPAFSPDGARAVSPPRFSNDSTLTGYTVSPDRVVKAWAQRVTDPVGKLSGLQPLEFLPDGDHFWVWVSAVDGTFCPRVMLCRWADGAARVSWAAPRKYHVPLVSLDARRVLCWDNESVTVLAYEAGAPERPPEQYTVPEKPLFRGGAYHPSSAFLAAGSGDEVLFLDARTFRVLRAYDWRIGPVHSVAFSPDGTLAAASGPMRKVVVWDVDV
jgi:WD40 repeat protein